MILVDTSAFIEYYRASGEQRIRDAVADAVAADQVAVNDLIYAEILSQAASEGDRRKLEKDFRIFHWLDLGREDYVLAARLGFDLRRRGTRLPPTDLIIAASAIRAGATLYHADHHFDRIARLTSLKARNLESSGDNG